MELEQAAHMSDRSGISLHLRLHSRGGPVLESVFVKSSEIVSREHFHHDMAVLVLPTIDHDAAVRVDDILRRRAWADGLLVVVDDDLRLGFIKVANLVFARSHSKYFGYLAEDAFPGDGWLKCALFTLENSDASLLAFNDGRFHGNLAVFGLVSRAWARQLYHNCLFYPGYTRHFGDTELSVLSRMLGKMTYNPNCLMAEVDYSKHVKLVDEQDEALYRQRARTGFGGLVEPFEPD